MEQPAEPFAQNADSRGNEKLRLARVSAILALALTIAFLALKVFQVLVTRIVVQGAPPSFVHLETAIGIAVLVAIAPIAAEIVTGHLALAGAARDEVRRRVLGTIGIAVGYFFLVCLALDIVLALLSSGYESPSVHTTLLEQLFYAIG
jgi:hypothetical protein